MESIGNLIRPKSGPTRAQSEWTFLVSYFHENLNREREGRKYPKLPFPAVAAKLKGLSVRDLYYLQSICENARRRGYPWSKTFWGALKPRPTV